MTGLPQLEAMATLEGAAALAAFHKVVADSARHFPIGVLA
jgi:hypothetical protein